MPSAKDWVGATDQLAPETAAVSVCTSEPVMLEPENTFTVIVAKSPGAVPAAPENVGLSLPVVPPFGGLVNVTAGG